MSFKKEKRIAKALVPSMLAEIISKKFKDPLELNCARKIISNLWMKSLNDSNKTQNYQIPFSYKYKIKLINGNRNLYKIYRKLEELNVYKSSSFSKLNKICKHVTLNPKYLNENLVEIEYIHSIKIDNSSYINTIETLKKLEFEFTDLTSILKCVESNKENILSRIQKNIHKRNEKQCYKKELINKPIQEFTELKYKSIFNKHVTILYSLLDKGKLYCKRNRTNMRLDNTMTRIPIMYFGKIKMQGEKLIEIDFKNCQPCLLAHLIENINEIAYWGNCLSNVAVQLKDIIGLESYHTLFSDLEKMVCEPDIQEYCLNCFNGTFYDSFLDGTDQDLKREEVKKLVMMAFFGNFKTVQRSKRYGKIQSKYPNLINLINKIKNILFITLYSPEQNNSIDLRSKRGNKLKNQYIKKGSNLFSILLQRMESYIFIDKLLPKLISAGIDVIPRHDSIIIKESNLEEVKKITMEIFDIYLGQNKYKLSIKMLSTGQ